MGNDRGVVRLSRHRDGIERFRHGADLIQLHQQRIADAFGDPLPQNLGIGDEDIVADQLHAITERPCQRLPAIPIAFGDAIFDRDDRVLPHPLDVQLHHLIGRARGLAAIS